MKFYHYTTEQRYQQMLSGERWGVGLLPARHLFHRSRQEQCGLPPEATRLVTFGLLQALDPAWLRQSHVGGRSLLESVLGNIRTPDNCPIYVVEAMLYREDKAWIANYGCLLRKTDSKDDPQEINAGVSMMFREYWNSLIPFADYEQGNTRYLVAEVLCFNPIPPDRLRVFKMYNTDQLIDHIRALGGYPPRPLRPKPDPAAPEKLGAHNFDD